MGELLKLIEGGVDGFFMNYSEEEDWDMDNIEGFLDMKHLLDDYEEEEE